MKVCSEEKRKLIEEIGVHFEQVHQLSPLAARIYAVLILSPNDGHTFEEIMEITKASKSSVSTQLNLLLQLRKVEYFTKSGDRKRYFRTDKMYLKYVLEEYLETVSEELRLVEKITQFNSTYNKSKFKRTGKIALLFNEYLKSQRSNIERTIDKMARLETQ